MELSEQYGGGGITFGGFDWSMSWWSSALLDGGEALLPDLQHIDLFICLSFAPSGSLHAKYISGEVFSVLFSLLRYRSVKRFLRM